MAEAQAPKQARTKRQPEAQPVSYMQVVDDVTRSGVTQAELAGAVGAATRTVYNWASGHNAPRGQAAERLLDIHAIVDLLSDAYTDEGINIWLHARNRNLDMQRPIDLLTEGDAEQVLEQARWVVGGM